MCVLIQLFLGRFIRPGYHRGWGVAGEGLKMKLSQLPSGAFCNNEMKNLRCFPLIAEFFSLLS